MSAVMGFALGIVATVVCFLFGLFIGFLLLEKGVTGKWFGGKR